MSALDYVRNVFTFSRELPFPTQYRENKTPVTVDVLEAGWIAAFIVGYIGFMILLPTIATKERLHYSFRITITCLIGIIIMVCNFGQEWEVGRVTSKMFYKAGSHEEINGTVGVKLGLRSVNITLYADPHSLRGDLVGEKINYNERFYWTWTQGRAGFGPFAGQIQREYREAQLKGAPYPILWVAEYFTFDGEGLRFGRHYRHAGWYAHMAVWCAAVCWALTIVLFKICIKTGSMMLSLLGAFLLTAAFIWCSFRNFLELEVIFNNDSLNGVLRTYYGIHWYLALITGGFCLICGAIMVIVDMFAHDKLCKFFGLNPFAILDEDYTDDAIETAKKEADIEMKDTKFKRMHKMTVIYKARGTKKYIKKDEQPRQIYTNEDYFNEENNPAVNPLYAEYNYDPNYLDQWAQYQQYYRNTDAIPESPEDQMGEYQDVSTYPQHQPQGFYNYESQETMQQHPHVQFEDDYFGGQQN